MGQKEIQPKEYSKAHNVSLYPSEWDKLDRLRKAWKAGNRSNMIRQLILTADEPRGK